MATIASEQSIVLDLPPSCVEICPKHPSLFVVGTYNLVREEESANAGPDDVAGIAGDQNEAESRGKKPQNRNGTLIVYNVAGKEMREIQVVSQPSAILDLHFCPVSVYEDILAVVSSTGTLAIFKVDPTSSQDKPLQHLATSEIPDTEDGVLCLSLAWHPRDPSTLAVTLSSGEVKLISLNQSWKIRTDHLVLTHDLEAWTVIFSPPRDPPAAKPGAEELTIYSGGDDSALLYASLVAATGSSEDGDAGELGLQSVYPPLTAKGHDAGVTAILPTTCHLADGSRVVITGSYDDNVRVLAIQAPLHTYGARKCKLLTEKNLEGGVWRLKLVRSEQTPGDWTAVVLVSCMHAGARVVEIQGSLEGGDWKVKVLGRFEEHRSMNYGSDFTVSTSEGGSVLTCFSTSFYDKLLCMWKLELP